MGRSPRWLTPARVAAACCAVLLFSTTAAAVALHADRPTEVISAGTPAPLPDEDTTTTSTTEAPTTSTTGAPAVTTTTTAKPRPPATTSTTRRPAPPPAPPAHSILGPKPAGSAVVPYQAGRSSWHGTASGITLDVAMDPPSPRTGDEVHFTVTATFPDRECCLNTFLFGDGGNASDPTSRCMTDTPGPATSTFTHVYNKAGRWEFSFQGMAGRCGDHNVYGALYGYLDVGAGTARGQGPAQPTIDALEARGPSDPVIPGYLKIWAKGADQDGWVARFVIDFGDGSPLQTRPGDPDGCRPTPSGWPAQSMAWIQPPYPDHQYATPGSYTITVTIVSTACDGSEEQHATATIPYRW